MVSDSNLTAVPQSSTLTSGVSGASVLMRFWLPPQDWAACRSAAFAGSWKKQKPDPASAAA